MQGEALNAAVACFEAWLDARGGDWRPGDPGSALAGARFFERHGESRFSPWDTAPERDARTVNRAGFRRVNESGETEFYLLQEVFKSEICAGRDWRFVARTLVDKGLLMRDEKGRSTRKERLPGIGNVRCYRFTARVFADTSSSSFEISSNAVATGVDELP